ncbi:MAG: YdcF family protein [Coriobacteriia bacterium]|nr:YdcF family protein [Coriobacteriia bacterium]
MKRLSYKALRFLSLPWTNALVRGLALFLGVFSGLNVIGSLLGDGFGADLWWIDLGVLPAGVGTVLAAGAAGLLVAYAIAPDISPLRRSVSAIACAALALLALLNVIGFYAAWRAENIKPAVPFPFSALIAFVLLALAAHLWVRGGHRASAFEHVATVIMALLVALAFPLAQVYFFGTTDYRREADVAVVFGAKVHTDGRLSWSLEERVRTGVDLFENGYVDSLLMSGGVGSNGVDEAEAMKQRAIELGVPADVILTDSLGVDTDSTARDTVALLGGAGATRVIAVSQFYHLPRIKMAFAALGQQVYTVPAATLVPIGKTPLFVAREIPGFWVYWMRAWWRDVAG